MTFLFDIGNVLLKLHFEKFHLAILGDEFAPLPDALNAIKDPYESGEITDEEFVSRSVEFLNRKLSHTDFTKAWLDIFSPNEPMWEVVRQLHAAGHRLILFSNTNSLHTRSFLVRFPEFSLFHHHHFSQEIRAMKPAPDFYQKAVELYRLDPAETVYLDDLPENIATGKDFGFHSWQYDYRDHKACLEWLRTLLPG